MPKFLLLLILQLILYSNLLYSQKNIHKDIAAVIKDVQDFRNNEWKKDSSLGHVLRSHTEDYYARRNQFYKQQFARLESINKSVLAFNDIINLELFRHDMLDVIKEYEFHSYLNPILSDAGFHTNVVGRTTAPIRSKKEVEQYILLLKDMPRYINEYIVLMRKGLAEGISQPSAILKGYENTYLQHIVDSVEKSTFFNPFNKKPAAISDMEWKDYQSKARTIILNDVVGSYKTLKVFFEKEYLPKTRKTLGASNFPNGRKYYEDRVRHYTTTNLSSEEVYQVGLKEVARIKKEMDSVIKAVHFQGSFKDFINFLRTDSRFYPKSAEELLKEASFIAKKIDGLLPNLFGKLPRQPYTVAPVPDYLAPTYTTGRYAGAPLNRAGTYWVNTYNLPSRTLYTLEALTLHEAVPGHHLQSALAKELDSVPEFRQSLYINAFGEGWGLYSEYLGHEMGFYKDPYSLFGRLTYDMWRACRLVIDVGIHTKNWTRDQAVEYLAENTALSIHEVNTEVNRYISWPGQALSYKIGEIKIREMRKKAENALKENFDVRAFHDMVLSNGSVTLSILEMMTEEFISKNSKVKNLK
jgi:uncharacterized protein (DUF885 family)